MLKLYGRYWWSFLLRGILAAVFGLVAIFLPGVTLGAIAILVAAFLFMDGVFSLFAALQGKSFEGRWWLLLLEGIAGVAIATLTIFWPGLTLLAIVYLIGAWALFTGTLEIAAAIRLRHEIEGEWLLGLGGVLSILFGLILFFSPGVGAIALVWLIGAYALIFGISLIFLGLKLRLHHGFRHEPNVEH